MQALGLDPAYDLAAVRPDDRAALPFRGGETAALERLEHYCQRGRVDTYKRTRNGMVGADYSTKLSPWLALGCVSARQVLQRVRAFERSSGIANEDTYWVVFELLWRDYMRFYALRHGTALFRLAGAQGAASGRQRWGREPHLLSAWSAGATGYPFIDANMRELRLTGFMSNRGRQNVASFLVRDLGLDWRLGAAHFERHLLDHDPCSNYGNWQYAAGVGSDPREDRYFNIVKQASMYDPDCAYIRLWCPELAGVPNQYLIDPRKITPQIRAQLGLSLETLPAPVCELQHGDMKSRPMSSGDVARRSRHGGVPGAKASRA